jgi:anti-anti-sigma factor
MLQAPFEHIRCPVLVLRLQVTEIADEDLSEKLRDQLLASYQHLQPRHIVLDLAQVRYMNSCGFRPLLSLLRELRSQEGRLLLCHLHPDVREVLRVTWLISPDGTTPAPLEACDDVADCMHSLELGSSL